MKHLRPYQSDALNTLRKRLKETKDPLLVTASVGSGKSLIIAELLLILERANWRALCLTMNAELISQNAETFALQGGNPGIYCAALNEKEHNKNIIFASPHSIIKGIQSESNISYVPFNLIVIDECHNINPDDLNSMYMRILNHYAKIGSPFRVVGLTGTPYRGKGISIVGDGQLFKEEICNLETHWLIENGFLVKPSFGSHNINAIDFSNIKVNHFGRFNGRELQETLDKNIRLTAQIMQEVSAIMENRTGAFIFASTRKHCEECAKSLPDGQWGIITGKTTQKERVILFKKARAGLLKYLINVNVLTVGIDIPNFDTVVFVRPTESLVLYTQAIGRGLRLHENKKDCLVLDYATNLDRHGDIDNPIINEALRANTKDDAQYCIPCYTCCTLNTVFARRCIGEWNEKRCDYYFDFKECPGCKIKNDKTARFCRGCELELIDPNTKLSLIASNKVIVTVNEATYFAQGKNFHATYDTNAGLIQEHFVLYSSKGANIFYGNFLRHHVPNASKYYPYLNREETLTNLIKSGDIKTPLELQCKYVDGRYTIVKRTFTCDDLLLNGNSNASTKKLHNA
ncbi:MAG: DEAD/DEAH box helicase [Bacteroidota bacterium]